MVTASATMRPTRLFLSRWTSQLIPELVKMNALTEAGVPVLKHWMEATVQELEKGLGIMSVEAGQRPAPVAEQRPESAQRIIPQMEQEGPWAPIDIINRLATNPQVTHVAFGAITSARGHRIQGIKGAENPDAVSFANSELQKKGLFMERWDGYFDAKFDKTPFRARITAPRRINGVLFLKLCFNDPTADSREGSHTDYTVGFPGEWGAKIIPTLNSHPECMILLFQRMFPEMDRTRGQLTMDPHWKTFYMKCAEYDQQALWPAIERLNWG